MKHALELNKANGNTLWQDSIALELKGINEYNILTSQTRGETGERLLMHPILHCAHMQV